jgi:hypothetical protein
MTLKWSQSRLLLLELLLLLFVHNNYNKNNLTTTCFEQYRISSGICNKCKDLFLFILQYSYCIVVLIILVCTLLVFVDGVYVPFYCYFDLFVVFLYLRFV